MTEIRITTIGSIIIATAIIVALSGCVTVTPVVVDQKTALENQLLGTFERLSDDIILASSVRNAEASPTRTPLEQEVIAAVMSRAYNEDDIDVYKRDHYVGESNTGEVVILSLPTDTQQHAQLKSIIEQENRDRLIIWQRTIQLNANLSPTDMPLIRQVFAQLQRKLARAGEKVQSSDGRWQLVTSTGK